MQNLINKIALAAAFVSGVAFVLIMALMFADVIGRYVFSSPLPFAVELIQLWMGLAITFGLAITTWHRGHIRVDLVLHSSPRPVRLVLDWLADLTSLVFFALVAWKLFEKAGQTLGDGIFTQILELPVAPVVFLMSFAAALALVVAIAMLFLPTGES